MPDKDEVPGSSPARPTTHRRRSERCRQRAGHARCRPGPRWGRTPIPAGTSSDPSGSAPPGVRLGDDHPPWSRPQPKDASHASGAASSCCSLLPCPPRRRPRRALPTPAWPAWSLSGQARPPRPPPTPAARVRHRPLHGPTRLGQRRPRPGLRDRRRASTARQSPGPPPVPVVRVARPPRPGPQRHRLSMGGDGHVRTHGWTADGWTPDGWTADGRAPDRWTTSPGDRTPDGWTAGSRTPIPGWVDTACWTAATDAVAWLLAGSTTATTPDPLRPAGRCCGQMSSGRAPTRTAQPQGRWGHPRCYGWVWPPPRPSACRWYAAVQLAPWRTALLGSDGSSVERTAKLQPLCRGCRGGRCRRWPRVRLAGAGTCK
jgi:hypothetical protein